MTEEYKFNGAKMREALELCDKIMSDVVLGVRDIGPLEAFDEMGGIIDQALADPPRNCDVGTAEEQMKRWREFCATHPGCDECPCHKKTRIITLCFAHWAQMPYKEGGTE